MPESVSVQTGSQVGNSNTITFLDSFPRRAGALQDDRPNRITPCPAVELCKSARRTYVLQRRPVYPCASTYASNLSMQLPVRLLSATPSQQGRHTYTRRRQENTPQQTTPRARSLCSLFVFRISYACMCVRTAAVRLGPSIFQSPSLFQW